MSIYYLQDHVYACIADGCVVFLDVNNDAYLSLPPHLTECFGTLASERKIDIYKTKVPNKEAVETIKNLSEMKIVTNRYEKIRFKKTVSAIPLRRDITDARLTSNKNANTTYLIKFIISLFQAIFLSKIMGFSFLIKTMRESRPTNINNYYEDKLRKALNAFSDIRPYFYTASKHCYFNCAVLMLYLRKCGFDPRWVYGVKMEPFEAHCWVQIEDIMVTDRLSFASPFQPIMVI